MVAAPFGARDHEVVAKTVAIKSWAKFALEQNKRDELDLKVARNLLAKLRRENADRRTVDDLEKRIVEMEKRAKDAAR